MKNLVILFLLISLNGFSQTLEESIQSVSSLPDSVQVDSMVRLSRLSAIADQADLGVDQARWAYQTAKNIGYKKKLVMSRFYIARNFHKKNAVDSALHHYFIILDEIDTYGNDFWRMYVLNNISNLYRQSGDYQKAIEFGIGTIEKYKNKLDSTQIGDLYSNLGYAYDRLKDFETAIDYQRIALAFVKQKDAYLKHLIFSRIAIANDDLNRFDSAHFYNQKVLNYYVTNGDSADVGPICSNIGNTYLKQKKWNMAATYLVRANRLNRMHGDAGNNAISNINLGNVYTELGEYEKAKSILNEGIRYSIDWNNDKFLSEGYFLKSKLFEKTGNFDSALVYYKNHKLLEDSLYALEKLSQIEEISTKYETEKKEQQIKIQKARLAENESQLEAKQSTIIALVILTLLAIVVGFAAYKRYQAKKNAEVQSRIIEEQEKGLQAVFTAQEDERKRISKDLHDGIGQQLSGLKMAIQTTSSRLIKNIPEEKDEFEKLAKIASDSADEVRFISHQMMPRALTELGLVEAIMDMLDKSLGLTNIIYEFEQFGITERLPEKIEVSLYRVAQELVNNIMKHSNAQKVNIQLFKNSGKIILVVEDDGEGIQSSKTEGHGLLNMKSRVNTLNGEMNLEPSPKSGTLATIRVPI